MLYIHNKSLDDFSKRTAEDVFEFARAFNNLGGKEGGDADFMNNMYRRGEISNSVKEGKVGQELYKYRHGLSPATKNIRNIRFKKE